MYSPLSKKNSVYRFWKTQWLLLSVVALLVSVLNQFTAWSFFCGGITFLVPHGYFIWQGFKHAGAMQAKLIFRDFCIGQVGKLFLTACLFLGALTVANLRIFPYFIGFFLMQSSLWLYGIPSRS